MKRLKNFVRILLLIIVLGALGIGALLLIRGKKDDNRDAPEFKLKPRPVTVTRAEKGRLTEKRSYLAVVEPHRTAHISARVTAPVTQVHCDEADRVEKGEALVTLDGQETKHRIDAVKAQIQQARADLDANRETIEAQKSSVRYYKAEAQRYRRLAEQNAVPESEAEKAEEKQADIRGRLNASKEKSEAIQHRIAALKQQVAELQTRLGYYTIKSPFSGVVTDVEVDPGDMTSPQTTIVNVEDRSSVKLTFDVPQSDLPVVSTGLPVRFGSDGTTREAMISLMYPSLNPARMMRAEARISHPHTASLTPGAYMPVSVIGGQQDDATLIPRSSLIESDDDEPHVFAVVGDRLKARPVEVQGYTDGRAAVTGISPGTTVVKNTYLGWAQLTSGEKVEAIQ